MGDDGEEVECGVGRSDYLIVVQFASPQRCDAREIHRPAGEKAGTPPQEVRGISANCTATKSFCGLTVAKALFMIEVRGGAVW